MNANTLKCCILRLPHRVMNIQENNKPSLWLMVLSIAGMAVVVVHFVLTALFSIREFVPVRTREIADKYSFPVFHQDWKLFAPDLAMYNSELEYRCVSNGTWSNWTDVTTSEGYAPVSRMERIEQGFNHQLAWQATNNLYSKDGVTQLDKIVHSTAYRNALYYAVKMHELHKPQEKYDSLQVRLNFRFTPKPEEHNTPAQYVPLEFPVYIPVHD